MKKLTDADIEKMVGIQFSPDTDATRRRILSELKLSQRIPHTKQEPPKHVVLDLHQHTIEQAWQEIMDLAVSGTRQATIITGASGILRQLFPQWVTESIMSPYIVSATPINNGSFKVIFKKTKNNT